MTDAYHSIFAPDLFHGQVALVTGGGTGIGRCIAHELASLGATVIVCGRRAEPLQQVVTEITAQGGRAAWINLNVRDEEQVHQVLGQIVADHSRLDLVVNNAGGQFVCEAEGIRPKGWRAVLDTNLSGPFWVCQAAFAHWMGDHGGAICNVAADMWNGFKGLSHTGAARAGVVNLTMTLGVEWAGRGIRVNAVAPGGILSSGLSNYPQEVQEIAADAMKQVPAARLGSESEVSAAVVFLLSPAASYITGATLRVDGGGSLAKVPMMPMPSEPAIAPYSGWPAGALGSQVPARFRT